MQPLAPRGWGMPVQVCFGKHTASEIRAPWTGLEGGRSGRGIHFYEILPSQISCSRDVGSREPPFAGFPYAFRLWSPPSGATLSVSVQPPWSLLPPPPPPLIFFPGYTLEIQNTGIADWERVRNTGNPKQELSEFQKAWPGAITMVLVAGLPGGDFCGI